ncbi:MAG: protein-L-isoaspartate(D-aspartate) O-methyltransferase [Deltaproteobacteria bacterium]|nr:protein-L-isoaspartate(D-aspartate) O-methyltransferase [Deltaproteobacteria bacterium]
MDYSAARESMVRTQLLPRGIKDTRVLQAMGEVPRERFMPEQMKPYAYDDTAFSIGSGQTISQPYIVALMTEALELKGTEKALEIGTGSGYQAAILARLSSVVYTVERIESLMTTARDVLDDLGYRNIFFKVFDGTLGWNEKAPYDAIVVTAAAPVVPKPLLEQLKENGRLVLPVGDQYGQDLIKITKKDAIFYEKNLGGVIFVKLIGEYGWSK